MRTASVDDATVEGIAAPRNLKSKELPFQSSKDKQTRNTGGLFSSMVVGDGKKNFDPAPDRWEFRLQLSFATC